MSYFAVYFAERPAAEQKTSSFIFETMADVLNVIKQHKLDQPRFRRFNTFAEAETFLNEIYESPKLNSIASPQSSVVEEPSCPYSAPNIVSLTGLRKTIEKKDFAAFQSLIDSNPRYLVNIRGDTPTILYEGCRYNAMHVAARSGNLPAAQAVAGLFRQKDCLYVRQLYPEDDDLSTLAGRQRQLLDLYLNMPDTGFCETPLHFAAKNGHVELVRFLCSLPECNRTLLNYNNQTAKEIALSRAPANAKEQILQLLRDDVLDTYVALYRARDEVLPPILCSPVSGYPAETILDKDPITDYRLAALIGPLDVHSAKTVYSEWQSRNRSPQAKQFSALKRSDLHKGWERVGRKLAGQHRWREYWSFLDAFVDLRTDDGLSKLEEYFKRKSSQTDAASRDISPDISSLDKNEKLQKLRRKLDFSDIDDSESAEDPQELFYDSMQESPDDSTLSTEHQSSDTSSSSELRHQFSRLSAGEENSMNGYYTPPQELTADVIYGTIPTKTDADAYAALENCIIDEIRFPRTAAWAKMIKDHAPLERRSWAPLDSPRSSVSRRKMFLFNL